MSKHIADKDCIQGSGVVPKPPLVIEALEDLRGSFERLCLGAGLAAIDAMLEEDAATLCGERYVRHGGRQAVRWGRTTGELSYHGGKAKVSRPRVRSRQRAEVTLPSWQAIKEADLLSHWAFNQMLIGVSTRKYGRSVRLPEGDVARTPGDGTSKSAVSRRFVALSAAKLRQWLEADLSGLDLLVIQIDGLHVAEHVMVAAVGIDGAGDKHPLALVHGATENTAVVQALLDDLLARGLDPSVARLFIIDGAKALKRAIRNTFGQLALVQRCQVHKGRNVIERLPKHLHAGVRKTLRQAWEQDDADRAERIIRNLARRLEHDAPGISATLLEGLDEILTVVRLRLPEPLRRSLACTNIIENMLVTIRSTSRNVKRWQDARMVLRWTAAGMLEANKTFRRLKAYKLLPRLRDALRRHQESVTCEAQLVGTSAVA